MKPLEQRAAAAAKAHVARMAVLAAEAVAPLSLPREERAAVVAAAITIVDREFTRNLAELEEEASFHAERIPCDDERRAPPQAMPESVVRLTRRMRG